MSVLGDITEAPPFGSTTSDREECYETMTVEFDCISKEITDLPNGLDGTPMPGGGYGPPTGTVTATLKFYGKVKNRKRYCDKPGLTGTLRGSVRLTHNTIQDKKVKKTKRHLILTSTMAHKITLLYTDWPCHKPCFPVEYDEDIAYFDGCTTNFPDKRIELEVQKYGGLPDDTNIPHDDDKLPDGTPISEVPFDQVIWNSHVNRSDRSLCFSPGIDPYQAGRLDDALGLNIATLVPDTCCNLSTESIRNELQKQIEDHYNSTHDQSDCKPFLA